MNYNLLWFVWLIWLLVLITFSLGWETSLELIRQFKGLLFGLVSTIVAGATFRNLLFNKEITMFKRKDNIIIPPQSSLPPSSAADAMPESEIMEHEETVSAVTVHNKSDTTTIPETCLIVGEINAIGDIHINGTVNGVINSEKTVFVQKNGRVDGEVYANRIEISGELKGVCRSHELAVNANGHLDGTIECESLSVNQNGRFYGHSKPYQQEPKEEEKASVQKITEPMFPLSQDFHLREQTVG
ncbi:bactofilin family protein [Erwinia mallotivora]|uniref:Polymer-forming cytoskeletal protein n=1 Tax=Erwinia mallotivora TaxID=69222 RepID=A0A014LX40_9GAMM|nr:polymer-forming cytoskeletal protein [Erwinia mallotivora]EXU74151.1 hypothetical protein BG55_18475 [Erwinia mallotivora]